MGAAAGAERAAAEAKDWGRLGPRLLSYLYGWIASDLVHAADCPDLPSPNSPGGRRRPPSGGGGGGAGAATPRRREMKIATRPRLMLKFDYVAAEYFPCCCYFFLALDRISTLRIGLDQVAMFFFLIRGHVRL